MTRTETMSRGASGSGSYRAGVAIAVVTALLSVWTTIVRDDGNGIGFFMVILAVAVGWWAAGFRAAGMARTMVGVAAMQVAVGALIATAPVTLAVPGASVKMLLFCGMFALLCWRRGRAFLGGLKDIKQRGIDGEEGSSPTQSS